MEALTHYSAIIELAKAVERVRRLDTVIDPRPNDLFLTTLEEAVDACLEAQRSDEGLSPWEAEMAWRVGEHQGRQG